MNDDYNNYSNLYAFYVYTPRYIKTTRKVIKNVKRVVVYTIINDKIFSIYEESTAKSTQKNVQRTKNDSFL